MAFHPSRNLGLKILSLSVAASIWYIVAREETAEAVFRAPVEFVNVPQSLEIASEPPGQVQIRVRAATTLMRKIYEGGIVTRVDLRDSRPGVRTITLGASNFGLPFGCQVIRITPASFDLHIEERDVRMVTISPRLEGRVAEGHEIVSLSCTPARVQVEGPASRVRRLSTVTTESVSVEGLVTSISQRVAIHVPDPSCRIPGDISAQLDVTITEKQESRIVSGVPTEAVPSSRGVTVTPDRVEVRLEGAISKVRWLQPSEIRARVNVSGLAPGRYSLPPRIEFSKYPDSTFRVQEVIPEKLQVAIR